MRIALAEVAQETDSFSPLAADLSDFEEYGLFFGSEILERMRGVGPIGGFLQIASERRCPVDVVPILRAWGSAGGTISAGAYAFLASKLIEGLRQALPVDGVFLSLHGAAAAVGEDDVEGALLAEVREMVGPGVPIVVALDHHANVTQKMVANANVLVGHETQPHDPPATGRKAAKILFQTLRGEIHPLLRWRKIPMITPQDQFLTAAGPMKEWFDLAREMEARERVLDCSPYPMQPWLDVAEGGWSVVVHTDGDEGLADALAAELANKAWALREQFWRSERVAPGEAIRQALKAEQGLIILSDTGDSVYGGAPGDSTCLLREMMAQRIDVPALVPMVDAEAVDKALEAGVGASLSIELGGKIDRVFNQPVFVVGKVEAASRGFAVDLHDRGVCDLRKTALLRIGSILVALLDHRSFAINHPVLYTHLGADVADARMVVLKTASNFQFFQRWRKGLIRVDSPGATQSDLTRFTWRRLPRPIYPLDPLADWRA